MQDVLCDRASFERSAPRVLDCKPWMSQSSHVHLEAAGHGIVCCGCVEAQVNPANPMAAQKPRQESVCTHLLLCGWCCRLSRLLHRLICKCCQHMMQHRQWQLLATTQQQRVYLQAVHSQLMGCWERLHHRLYTRQLQHGCFSRAVVARQPCIKGQHTRSQLLNLQGQETVTHRLVSGICLVPNAPWTLPTQR